MRRQRLRYILLGLIVTVTLGLGQVYAAGPWGWAFSAAGWLPWWLLWRFGWRKQFTHRFRDDGGSDLTRRS